MAVSMIGPKFYAWDRNGKPLAFGKLYTYQARTNVPKPTYQSEDQVVENTNPVILNGEGYANVYLDGSYKMVLKDDDDNEIWSSDPVSSAQADEWVNCVSASYLSPTSLKIPGNFTEDYKEGLRVRIDNNAINYSFSTIVSSILSGQETVVTISDPVIETGIVGICRSVTSPDSISTFNTNYIYILHDTLEGAKKRTDLIYKNDKKTLIKITDRDNGIYEVVSGETANGYDIVAHDINPIQLKITFSGVIDLKKMGYVGDYRLSGGGLNPSPTDNNGVWLRAVEIAKSEDLIIVTSGAPGYVSTPETISIPKGVMVKQFSPQYCDNDTHDFTLWDYDGEGQQFGDFRFDLRPTNNATTWSNTGEIGLTIRNCQEIDCDIKSLWGFYTGLRLIGENNKGVAHCTFNLGLMFDNKIDISIYGTGTQGYVNQNTFNQGQFITSSTLNQATGKYAVVIDHEGTYKHNSNVFYNPSLEKKSDAGEDNVAILMRAGRNNNFYNVRAEMKNGKAVMRVEGTSERNVATVLFSNGVNGLVNAGTGSNNIVSNVYDQPYDFEVFNIGDFSQLIREPASGQSTSFGLDMWRAPASSPSYWDGSSNFSVDGKLSVMTSGNAVGKLVNTVETKKLTAFASFSDGTSGRILCIPFDENMTPITDLTDFKTINSQTIASEGGSFTGGAFTFGVNIESGSFVVEVTEACKYLWVGAYAKGSTAKCNQLSVSTVKSAGSGLIAISPGYSSNGIPTTLDLPLGSFFHRINRNQSQSRGWSFDGSAWFED